MMRQAALSLDRLTEGDVGRTLGHALATDATVMLVFLTTFERLRTEAEHLMVLDALDDATAEAASAFVDSCSLPIPNQS